MNDLEVLVHEHDRDEGVYRLVVGAPLINEVGREVEVGTEPHPDAERKRDEAAAVRAQADQLGEDDADAAALLEAQASALEEEADELPEVPAFEVQVTQERVGTVPVEDFVFAADDERWEGMSPEAVAQAQRELVAEALAEREAAARAEADRDVTALPGAGTALTSTPLDA